MRKSSLLTLALLALATVAGAETLEEKFDKTYDVKSGSQVELSNVNGSITISSWDQPRVRVQAVKTVKADDAKQVMRDLRIEISQTAGGLKILTRTPSRNDGLFDWLFGGGSNASVKYELTVPRSMNLEVETVNGAVSVKEIAGTMELETTNGRIEVARCEGKVDAETTNGAINVELVRVTGQPMTFETTNGRITLSVPNSIAAKVDADTTNGSINSELPMVTSHVERTSLRGTLNGGGPELKLRTTNGSIAIKKLS